MTVYPKLLPCFLSLVQEEKQNLSLSEASLKQECSQQQAAIHQLQGELTTTRSQLSTITDEQKHLYTQVQEVSELELWSFTLFFSLLTFFLLIACPLL